MKISKRYIILFCIFVFSFRVNAFRELTPEAKIFNENEKGVFTIFGDFGHGSGFLFDEKGFILTNYHVISSSIEIRVQIDEFTKINGELVVFDKEKDIAILRINSEVAKRLPVLKLAPLREEIAFTGERVLAIGSPLNQRKILTSGIVSKVEKNVIISDVNINPGNSGGPLINMDGEVIGINTFGDFSEVGPGLSGSIIIYEAAYLIEQAQKIKEKLKPLPVIRYPVMPKESFPLWALRYYAENENPREENYLKIGPSKYNINLYNINFYTPISVYRTLKQREIELANTSKNKNNPYQNLKYDPYNDLKEWAQYVGYYAPTVIIDIIPKIGETSGSGLLNLLGSIGSAYSGTPYRGNYTYEFKGNLKDFRLVVEGKRKKAIMRGLVFLPLDFMRYNIYGTYQGKDLARAGRFIYNYEHFAPINDNWPDIKIEIIDINKPNVATEITLPVELVEKIWKDFEPYREKLANKKIPLLINNIK